MINKRRKESGGVRATIACLCDYRAARDKSAPCLVEQVVLCCGTDQVAQRLDGYKLLPLQLAGTFVPKGTAVPFAFNIVVVW